MSDRTLPNLIQATSLVNTDLLYVVQGNGTLDRSATLSLLQSSVLGHREIVEVNLGVTPVTTKVINIPLSWVTYTNLLKVSVAFIETVDNTAVAPTDNGVTVEVKDILVGDSITVTINSYIPTSGRYTLLIEGL